MSKKLQKSINELIFLIAGLIGLFTWIKTMNLGTGLVTTFILLGIYVLIIFLLRFKRESELKKQEWIK